MEERERRGLCLTCGDVYSALTGGRVEGNGYSTSRKEMEFGTCGGCSPPVVPAREMAEKFVADLHSV